MTKENLIEPEEIRDFYKNLKLVIDDVDCKNPLKVYSFANSLMNMGNYFLNEVYSNLMAKGYTEDEIKEFEDSLQKKGF